MRLLFERRTVMAAATFACLSAVGLGCGLIESTTTGELGNLSFSYDTSEEIRNFNKPIAPGAKLRITVRDAGGAPGTGAEVKAAATDNPSVATVVSFEDGREIAWRHFGRHVWRWRLEPVEAGTMVTESFEWDQAIAGPLYGPMQILKQNDEAIRKTLEHLHDKFADAA